MIQKAWFLREVSHLSRRSWRLKHIWPFLSLSPQRRRDSATGQKIARFLPETWKWRNWKLLREVSRKALERKENSQINAKNKDLRKSMVSDASIGLFPKDSAISDAFTILSFSSIAAEESEIRPSFGEPLYFSETGDKGVSLEIVSFLTPFCKFTSLSWVLYYLLTSSRTLLSLVLQWSSLVLQELSPSTVSVRRK